MGPDFISCVCFSLRYTPPGIQNYRHNSCATCFVLCRRPLWWRRYRSAAPLRLRSSVSLIKVTIIINDAICSAKLSGSMGHLQDVTICPWINYCSSRAIQSHLTVVKLCFYLRFSRGGRWTNSAPLPLRTFKAAPLSLGQHRPNVPAIRYLSESVDLFNSPTVKSLDLSPYWRSAVLRLVDILQRQTFINSHNATLSVLFLKSR